MLISLLKGSLSMKKIIYTVSVLAIVLTTFTARPALALEKGFLSIFGPIVGMPIGAVAGLLRGSMTKSYGYADSYSESLGDKLIGRIIGVPTGLVVGTATGGVTGLVKGLYDGLVIGVNDPLSAESASVDGKLLDYEPYEVFKGSSKNEQVQ